MRDDIVGNNVMDAMSTRNMNLELSKIKKLMS